MNHARPIARITICYCQLIVKFTNVKVNLSFFWSMGCCSSCISKTLRSLENNDFPHHDVLLSSVFGFIVLVHVHSGVEKRLYGLGHFRAREVDGGVTVVRSRPNVRATRLGNWLRSNYCTASAILPSKNIRELVHV